MSNSLSKSFLLRGDRLRKERDKASLSQRELARICKIAENMIYRYENGLSDPSATNLTLIATTLSVSADYLLGLTDAPRGQFSPSDLDLHERELVDSYRRESWIGVMRLLTDQMPK